MEALIFALATLRRSRFLLFFHFHSAATFLQLANIWNIMGMNLKTSLQTEQTKKPIKKKLFSTQGAMRRCFNAPTTKCLYVCKCTYSMCVCKTDSDKWVCTYWNSTQKSLRTVEVPWEGRLCNGFKKILLLLSLASIHFLSYVIKKDKRVSKWNCFFLVHCPTSSIFC